MAGEASRALFIGEEVLHLLDCDDELDDADLDEIFFPGSVTSYLHGVGG